MHMVIQSVHSNPDKTLLKTAVPPIVQVVMRGNELPVGIGKDSATLHQRGQTSLVSETPGGDGQSADFAHEDATKSPASS